MCCRNFSPALGSISNMTTSGKGTAPISTKNDVKNLPFRYQFVAGAVAGISEILVM
jgi:hypothetical protein